MRKKPTDFLDWVMLAMIFVLAIWFVTMLIRGAA
jgi:hypothetical protein